ncbi:MAG: hypothetical protein Q9170_003017 [Blastenia crenularia]
MAHQYKPLDASSNVSSRVPLKDPINECLSTSFFSLPPELRDIIYKMALVRDQPIDLWPQEYVSDYRSLAPRVCAMKHFDHNCRASVRCRCGWRWEDGSKEKPESFSDCKVCRDKTHVCLGDVFKPSQCPPGFELENVLSLGEDMAPYQDINGELVYVRDQHDLEYVRKNFNTALLSTSKEIRAEALIYFYGQNTFRFSGRGAWYGLLRFLLTIGAAARRHLTVLEVCAPFIIHWPDSSFFDIQASEYKRILDERSKNNPKLHMTKIKAENSNIESVIRQACEIILRDGTLQKLNLIIPSGCHVQRYSYGLLLVRFDYSLDSRHPLHLLTNTEVNLVVEENACLDIDLPFVFTRSWGWNLVCRRGSCVRDSEASNTDEENGRRLEGLQRWKCGGPEAGVDGVDYWSVSPRVILFMGKVVESLRR